MDKQLEDSDLSEQLNELRACVDRRTQHFDLVIRQVVKEANVAISRMEHEVSRLVYTQMVGLAMTAILLVVLAGFFIFAIIHYIIHVR